jgi:hypothetical protein
MTSAYFSNLSKDLEARDVIISSKKAEIVPNSNDIVSFNPKSSKKVNGMYFG